MNRLWSYLLVLAHVPSLALVISTCAIIHRCATPGRRGAEECRRFLSHKLLCRRFLQQSGRLGIFETSAATRQRRTHLKEPQSAPSAHATESEAPSLGVATFMRGRVCIPSVDTRSKRTRSIPPLGVAGIAASRLAQTYRWSSIGRADLWSVEEWLVEVHAI